MKYSEALANELLIRGIVRGYGLQGGSVSHLIDSFISLGGDFYFHHHEQHSAIAATGDYLASKIVPVVFISTGPAGTNAITGLLGAYQDSIPIIFISGQARSDQLSYKNNVRQIGSQEAPILDIVRPLTKWSKLVEQDDSVASLVAEAIRVATSERNGPVWLDIPIDIQLLEINS